MINKIKILAILVTDCVLLLIHIISPIITKYLVNSKVEWLDNIIFAILSALAIWFIFFTNNKE